MITFKLYQDGIYLTEADISDPSGARVGFMFLDAQRTDPTFTLSSAGWVSLNNTGFFVFFVPSSTRDWGTFATSVRSQFSGMTAAQFGWALESGSTVTVESFILVDWSDPQQPAVLTTVSLIFNNVTLQIQSNQFGTPTTISFDDTNNQFLISNPAIGSQQAVLLTAQPPFGQAETFYSNSQNLLLPMLGPQAASINAGFQFDPATLVSQFEGGFMYFAPPPTPGTPLTALNYPLLRSPGSTPTLLNFNVWLDLLQPLVATRSYFQLTDAQLSSYFSSSTGRTFALRTVDDGDADNMSRYVFANRPYNATSDKQFYYLAPAGKFYLASDGGTMAEVESGPESGSNWLLCGVTGTEFLKATVTGSAADAFYFEPGQPAFSTPSQSQSQKSSSETQTFLDSVGGNVTTSWVQYITSAGEYVSQPQESPLFQQEGSGSAQLEGYETTSGIQVYTLNFNPLASWSAAAVSAANAAAAVDGPVSGPPVPMVPYAGVSLNPNQGPGPGPYNAMELNALNPTRKNAYSKAQPKPKMSAQAAASDSDLKYSMMPQGLLAGLTTDPTPVWQTLRIAKSPSGILEFLNLGTDIRQTLLQNQIFAVISTTQSGSLFEFAGVSQRINIADWIFNLTPDGTKSSDAEKTPPILILKFYPGASIASLVNDMRFWSLPDIFNTPDFKATQAQAYLQNMIQDACSAVYKGQCTDGSPNGGAKPDTSSLYYNFYQVVTDPNFSGLLAVNCNMELDDLPLAIRAILGGMTKTPPGGGPPVSNIDAFRVHHVGVQINDTDPQSTTPTLTQSSLFGLVDYEKPEDSSTQALTVASEDGIGVDYSFEVEYLRALFTNSELRQFACKINLTVNSLFATDVTLDSNPDNIVVITGSYQAHSGDDGNTSQSSGQDIYSFVAEGKFAFNFATNPYLKSITLTKLQFSFLQETLVTSGGGSGTTTTIESRFSIWGSMVFNQLNVLDIFSFEKLSFADLGIGVKYNLTTFQAPPNPPPPPVTTVPQLTFSPGDLRFDFAQTTNRQSSTSLLSLIPFKLKSFLYSQNADQTLESLKYFSFSANNDIPALSSLSDTFNFALIFDLDLGSMGGLVGSLSAFKFSIIIGWLSGPQGGLALGVQLPQADGKLEIKIEGVLTISIQEFKLQYQTITGTGTPRDGEQIFVLGMHNTYLELLGKRLPPGAALFDFALFVPTEDAQQLGWIAAYNNEPSENGGGGTTSRLLTDGSEKRVPALASEYGEGSNGNGGGGGEGSSVFELLYLGGGQRVGPDPNDSKQPTNFKEFKEFMTTEFWDSFKKNDYAAIYHPESKWLVVADIKLLGIVELGFVFYDYTPFYSLMLNVEKLFEFEITYTKISDSIGLFYMNFTLPDSLRTFQVGAASLTLPSIAVSVYTNGNWKLDVGFPAGDDWSRSFQIQAQAGPVPVTGAGGFYIASLSSATFSIFKGNYPSILAFGFAARLGVGKDFTSGPLKAGISVTFFGIIEGAAGYLSNGSDNIFKKPDALSLKGQFGLIGEIYGSIDFVIIQASVNVTLQASIGIEIMMEGSTGGTILLYVEASVRVSVSVKINLGFFSIHISFSFNASFRFQWQLGGSSSAETMRLAVSARMLVAPSVLALCPGINPAVGLWFLPEVTVYFPTTMGNGTPWFVGSLSIEYDPNPPATITYSDFKPFEAVTAQLTTWALSHVLELSGCSSNVTEQQIDGLDQTPESLVGWIDYPTLLTQLANFQVGITVPSSNSPTQVSAAPFPMFPFLWLTTTGRLDSSGKPADLKYQFSSMNEVPQTYIDDVQTQFKQLYVNQTQAGATSAVAAPQDDDIPLSQEIFLDYFTGLIRGAVHQLLQTMQDNKNPNDPTNTWQLDQLIMKAVGSGLFASLAGQVSSMFRGGVRLPTATGLTVPDGMQPQASTYPLYALLWQEFPVGGPVGGPVAQYTIALTNPDTDPKTGWPWVKPNVDWTLTDAFVSPYQKLTPSDVALPSQPTQLPFTNTGPQSFAFENPTPWTQGGTVTSLRPFPSNLQQLQQATVGPISVVVASRATGSAYLPGGTPLDPKSFTWATRINITIKQVPGGKPGTWLPDVYALSGASQQDQALLEQILNVLQPQNPIASIQVLYQTEAGATGLNSAPVKPADVFVLRTNTTTVSAPPTNVNLMLMATAPQPTEVAVGAQIDEDKGFLQIIQQAAVTNAPGYYLRYQDTAGDNLPTKLFTSGPAPLTLLISYVPDNSLNTQASPAQVQPYYNTIALSAADATLLYYACTTDPALDTQYNAVASGSVGVSLTRDDSSMQLQVQKSLAATHGLKHGRVRDSFELISALYKAGVKDEAKLHTALAQANAAPAQLNALYSLVTYQVEQSNGFIKSYLSAPIQPQQPNGTNGDAPEDDGEYNYRVFVPLYNLADDNQNLQQGVPPNRYASINDPFDIDFYLNDAFGNQLPNTLSFGGTNLYFDQITPIDEWMGVVTRYDFLVNGAAQANSFTVHLEPSAAAFNNLTLDQATAALQLYYTVYDQITSPGVSFYIETNLALQSGGTMTQVTLTQAQQSAVEQMVSDIITYLEAFITTPQAFNVQPVPLSITVTGAGTLPLVFEMAVLFGIQRDPALISPLLKDQFGNITYPPAQNVSSTVASSVGSATSPDINTFAANFRQAFTSLALSVGLNGAQQQQKSSTAMARSQLRASGVPVAGTGSGQSGPQSLWAVQALLLNLSIGQSGSAPGPRYASPKPLDNTLNTGLVNLPTLPNTLTQLPTQQLFVDVDLDLFNRAFFQAVDDILAPASAAQAFEQARDAYQTITNGRKALSQKYSDNEVDWLFNPNSPFTGTQPQLVEARETFEQQMRAALMTAYSVDTIVQFAVTWASAVPSEANDQLSLFGQVQPTGGNPLPKGAGLSTVTLPVRSDGQSVLTFTYGTSEVQDVAEVEIDLEFNITHVEYFLEPKSATPPDEARPSVWLQLVDPYPPNGLPHIGPAQTKTTIPLVFRQFPTPPTIINQSGVGGASSTLSTSTGQNNPLTAAAAWHYDYSYQAQLTVHDQIVTAITYNTNLNSSSGTNTLAATAEADEQLYTLFQALARFTAAYAVLQPVLNDLTNPSWKDAAQAFSSLVLDVQRNTNWNPVPANALGVGGQLNNITDSYNITDLPQQSQQLITLTWDANQGETSWPNATLSVVAMGTDGKVFPGTEGVITDGITYLYTPPSTPTDDWVIHQIEVDSLNVLMAENALSSVQIERNLIKLTAPDQTTWDSQDEFIYMTPVVSSSQPVTPFVDNSVPIDVTQLPNQGASSTCPTSQSSLCQRIYTIMNDLLGDQEQVSALLAAKAAVNQDDTALRRVKIACSFQYPFTAAAGGVIDQEPISPLVPVVLARSFEIDGNQPDQLNEFAALYTAAIKSWSGLNGVTFGPNSQPAGAQLVFDITLYAQLSGLNTPVLRLRSLQLKLTDIDPL
jgi:large repetitive protein